ncbi:MAG: hypothetical protein ACRC67_18290 [Inquilinus sp.]|uniref:hypothetical protein n=1 Tax=Inquilinus sp. TaxID=1932117 RepID=UPI003F39C806
MTNDPRESMDEWREIVTRSLKFLFDTVGATHPIRFGLALAGGLGAQAMANVAFAAFPSQNWLLAIYNLHPAHMIALAFVLLFCSLLLPRKGVPEPVRVELALVEELVNKAGLNKAERHHIYLEVLNVTMQKGHLSSSIDLQAIKKYREKTLEPKLNDKLERTSKSRIGETQNDTNDTGG